MVVCISENPIYRKEFTVEDLEISLDTIPNINYDLSKDKSIEGGNHLVIFDYEFSKSGNQTIEGFILESDKQKIRKLFFKKDIYVRSINL